MIEERIDELIIAYQERIRVEKNSEMKSLRNWKLKS